MAQEKARELLTGLAQTADRRQTGAHEIADRLMSLIGNPYGGQFASPMQPGQIDRVPPIRLDPISRFARDQRRSHDDATMPSKGQLPLNPIAARSGLITEPKLVPSARQFRSQSLQSRRRVRDLAILAHVLAPARLGKRDRNRVLVHVKADICDSFVQDPSPMHEALRRNPAQPSTSLHTVRRVALSQANMWSRGRAIERSDAPGFAPVMLEGPAEKASLDGAVLEILVGAMVARVPLTADGATLARIVRALKGAA